MKQGTRKLLLGLALGAGAGAAAAAAYQMNRKLVGIAISREEQDAVEQIMEKFTSQKNPDSFTNEVATASVRLKNCDTETVTITGQDGLRLVGHWRSCQAPRRVLIAMHGWRSQWYHDFALIADFWERSGCCVLFAEQRGQGSSEGEYIGFGLLERFDCRDWARWAAERTGGRLPIYLAGVSMGAATVLMAAGLELPSAVRGILADCGFTSPQEIWKSVARRNLHLPYTGLQAAVINGLCRRRLQIPANGYSTLEAMAVCPVPVLLIHGTEDWLVPVEMTYQNYMACTAPKRLLIVPGAGHGMSYHVEPHTYEETVLRFWQEWETENRGGADGRERQGAGGECL